MDIKVEVERLNNLINTRLIEVKDEIRHIEQEQVRLASELHTAYKAGDLRENAAYHAALEESKNLTYRLMSLERTKRIFSSSKLSNYKPDGYVGIGSTVVLEDSEGKAICIKIVPKEMAVALDSLISVTSAIGKAIEGCTVGDKILVSVQAARYEYKILDVY